MQTQTTTAKVTSSNATQACLAIKLPRVEKAVQNAKSSADLRTQQRQSRRDTVSAQSYDFVGIAG